MIMMYRLPLTLLFFCCALLSQAAQVSRSAARTLAADFLRGRGVALAPTPSPHRAPSASAGGGAAPYYVFDVGQSQGFVIIAGDDRVPPVLGYADSGVFPAGDQPDGLRWLLARYAEEMASLAETADDGAETPLAVMPDGMTLVERARHTIAPMLTTRWNQTEPYNNLCPVYNGSDGKSSGSRAVTGCVATALAQVLYHYRHPAALLAEIPGYEFDSGGNTTIEMPAIAAGTAIDWDNMLDAYTSGAYTDAQAEAVARLMVMCGTAVEMGYGASSGANTYTGYQTLASSFGYSDAMVKADRGSHTLRSWIEMLYSELAEGYPVLYDGQSPGGGHAFVIDGYSGDDLFHVNWGWGGMSDGYYRITVLDPNNTSGAGAGGGGGYSMDQTMTLHLRVAGDGSVAPAGDLRSCYLYRLGYTGTQITGYWAAGSGFNASVRLGFGLRGEDGSVTPVAMSNRTYTIAAGYGYNITLDLGTAEVRARFPADGTYRLYPICQNVGSSVWTVSAVPAYTGVAYSYMEVTLRDGTLTLNTPGVPLSLVGQEQPGSHKKSTTQEVRFTLRNVSATDEYYGTLFLFAGTGDTQPTSAQSKTQATVAAGGEETVSLSFTPYSTGTYHLWLTTASNQVIGTADMEITATGTGTTTQPVTSGLTAACTYLRSNSDQTVVYGDRIDMDYTLTASASAHGTIMARLAYEGENGSFYIDSRLQQEIAVSLEAGETQRGTVTYDGLSYDTRYSVLLSYSTSTSVQGAGFYTNRIVTMKPGIRAWDDTGGKTIIVPATTLAASSSAATYDLTGVTQVTAVSGADSHTLYVVDAGAAVSGLPETNVVRGGTAESLSLADGHAFFAPRDFTAREARYTLTVSAGSQKQWQTLLLPFAPTQVTADGQAIAPAADASGDSPLVIREFAGVSGSEAVFANVTTLEAGKPYVIHVGRLARADRDVEVVFSATDAAVPATQPLYKAMTSVYDMVGSTLRHSETGVYVMDEGGTAFLPAQTATLLPARCHIVAHGAQPGRIPLEQVATAITSVTTALSAPPATYYDLQGRRVSSPRRGVYLRVQGGKARKEVR